VSACSLTEEASWCTVVHCALLQCMHGAGEPGGVLHACTYVHVRALACIEAAAPQALVDPEPDLVKAYTTCMQARQFTCTRDTLPMQSLRFASHACVRAFSLFVLAPSLRFFCKS
jgi:hypothetical protein